MHWPTDVLGGLGTGMLAGAVVLLLEARWKRP
jgi:membrane-associated phospholipid phosphatase